MQKREFKKPNFSIDRTRRGGLAKQITFGLRTAIETGYYRAGEILPPVRDLADILGVSMGIAVRAVNQIREAGLINPRPAVGSVVCAPNRPLWKGQVLIISPFGGTQHYMNAVCATICATLIANGYLALTVAVPRNAEGEFDFSMLDLMLRQQVDLVVQLHDKPEITKWLSICKIPFIRLTFDSSRRLSGGCIGAVRRSNMAAETAFAEHCRQVGVKDAIIATAWKSCSVISSLRNVGVGVKRWRFDIPHGVACAQVAQCAFDNVSCWIEKSKGKLPELIFFDDDFLASGALAAMLHAGVRIPEDICFATLFNRSGGGSGIAFSVPITRMEVDSHADGQIVAEATLSYLKNGIFPSDVTVGAKYIRGQTF